MSKNITCIEGIGSKTGVALRKADVSTVGSLLDAGRTKAGRKNLAATSGIDETQLVHCVNMANLFRVNGVASQLAELLVAAGGDTVKELRDRNAVDLTGKVAEVNAAKKLGLKI